MSYKKLGYVMRYKVIWGISLLIFFYSCNTRSVEKLQLRIDAVSKQFVPDKRVGISSLKLIKRGGGDYVLSGESMFPASRDSVLQLLSKEGLNAIDSVLILPDSIRMGKTWGLITLSVANIRSKPAHSSEMVSQAVMGTPVRLLKETDEWILIQTPDRYIGWTNQSAVEKMTDSSIRDWRKASRLIFTDTYGNIYQDINKTEVLCDLVAGVIVEKLEEKNNLYRVSLPDGRSGYVSDSNWLDFNEWKDTVVLNDQNLISTGKRFLGFPYLWGGYSSKALDCSGFVKTVCFLNGYVLERDASQQINHGTEIDISSGWNNLKKGDLLFFGSKTPYRITHVGLYIGNGDYIHESGCVKINSFDPTKGEFKSDLLAKFVGARRIIGSAPDRGCLPVKSHNWY